MKPLKERAIEIGISRRKNLSTGRSRAYKYTDLPCHALDWLDVTRYLPYQYDLVHLRLKDRAKLLSGWWDGNKWKGLHLRVNSVVTHWKRNMDSYTT